MIEMEPKDEWIGRALTDTEKLRSKENLKIVAVRKKGKPWHLATPTTRLDKDDILLIVREGHGDR